MWFTLRASHFQGFYARATCRFYVHKLACSNRPQTRSHSRRYPEPWMHEYSGWEYWTEDLSKYERGVYYAVHLGDEFGDGRYKVLHKVGNGVSSQLWLARDQCSRGHGYVALKVVPAGTRETQILTYLAQRPSRQEHHPGYRHVMRLLDHVPISGSSGSYDCLVLEIVGLDLFSLLKSGGGLPYTHAKRTSAQVARGLAYMHDLKICHGGQ
ncbi:hypothetical protein VTN77DRAFT_3668 [Rasamsonia byssochlamydoides]|uniref:uncharacterized protein n=1 Tax=Rasamsonia byssochlamydoides TaxID=89139 RepID=UPI00374313C5